MICEFCGNEIVEGTKHKVVQVKDLRDLPMSVCEVTDSTGKHRGFSRKRYDREDK